MSDKKTPSAGMGAKEKKSKKTGLGKGLDALFPEMEIRSQSQDDNLFECDIDKIHQGILQRNT